MAQQTAGKTDVSWEESVDVPSEQVTLSAFGKGADTFTKFAHDSRKDEQTVSSSRGTEELGHLVEEVTPSSDPANITTAAIYDPQSGTYSRPDTGKIDVGPIGSTLHGDEQLQGRLEKLEPPAADARLHSASIKRGATEIDKNPGTANKESDATTAPPQGLVSPDDRNELNFGRRQPEDTDPVQQLKTAKVIPLLIDRVQGNPSFKFKVRFHGKEVPNGSTLQPEDLQQVPEVLLYKDGLVTPEDVYLLLLVDMDFSNDGGYLHWLVQNVPSPTQAYIDPVRVFGQDLVPYEGQGPEKARQHRLVFLIYKMKRKLLSSAAPIARENFVPRHFAQNNDLGQAEAALYFKV